MLSPDRTASELSAILRSSVFQSDCFSCEVNFMIIVATAQSTNVATYLSLYSYQLTPIFPTSVFFVLSITANHEQVALNPRNKHPLSLMFVFKSAFHRKLSHGVCKLYRLLCHSISNHAHYYSTYQLEGR